MSVRRYAIVGLGARSEMYLDAITRDFTDMATLVGLCDKNPGRLKLAADAAAKNGSPDVPCYDEESFEQMIAETKPDEVIVTTMDCTHDHFIRTAMHCGCDAISEKPMTTDEQRCQAILKTQSETGRRLRVTFNYRYSPARSQLKEILQDGTIGDVLSVDFAWPLDTSHGADYFRRWHRNRENSGSLLVHKSTHHFDLVNWWLADKPVEVFCHASREFYVPETAKALGLSGHGERCLDCKHRDKCPFVLKLEESPRLKALYLDCESHDGYFRDRCVFSDAIDIWDNMSVSVKYERGAILNYLLHTYSPWEGYQIAFNGRKGRLEHGTTQFSYISGSENADTPGKTRADGAYTTIMPHFVGEENFQSVKLPDASGGHGGGDIPLLKDIFDPQARAQADPLGRAADHTDGAMSILVGIAARRSAEINAPVKIADLLGDISL